MDGAIGLVCGMLSINPDIAKESGRSLYLPEDRISQNYEEMLEKESSLPAGQRMDFVTIVTPNFAHFAPAMLALEKGFHVVIEKPITFTLDEARQLKEKSKKRGCYCCLPIPIPGGRPEGYLEAFANLDRNFALTLSARLSHSTPHKEALDFPSVDEGIRGMAFIENVVASNASTEKNGQVLKSDKICKL